VELLQGATRTQVASSRATAPRGDGQLAARSSVGRGPTTGGAPCEHDDVVLCFAGVELDREARELRRGGALVPVEPQVFDVLAYLAEHRDRLVTKEELLDEVWGNRFVSDSAVTSRIKSARGAVGDSGREQRVIRTIHRRGFRLVAEVVARDARATGEVAVDTSPVDELVGRDDELAAVLAALRPGRAVFVVGEPGVGKSHLVREAVRRVPGPVLAAHATPATRNVPFGALAPLLPAEVARIGNGDRLAILGALDAELAQRAGSVLLLDDAHTLDEMSAAVVEQAVADGRLAVLATARTGSALPESLDRLRPSGRAEWHELGPLDEPSIRRVVHGQLPGGVEPATHVELWRVSRGNPLLAREVVTSGLERGTLQTVDGRWRAVGPLVAGDRLVDVIRSRYAGMTDRLRRGLEVVVVAGDVPLELAEELLGLDGLDELEGSGVLRVDVDGRRHVVRSGHPLHAEAVEATLGLLARRRAARQLAEHLQAPVPAGGRTRSAWRCGACSPASEPTRSCSPGPPSWRSPSTTTAAPRPSPTPPGRRPETPAMR
jgi:DNA-binding winged helix-turn-helix (wHTH) protein